MKSFKTPVPANQIRFEFSPVVGASVETGHLNAIVVERSEGLTNRMPINFNVKDLSVANRKATFID